MIQDSNETSNSPTEADDKPNEFPKDVKVRRQMDTISDSVSENQINEETGANDENPEQRKVLGDSILLKRMVRK